MTCHSMRPAAAAAGWPLLLLSLTDLLPSLVAVGDRECTESTGLPGTPSRDRGVGAPSRGLWADFDRVWKERTLFSVGFRGEGGEGEGVARGGGDEGVQ